jgi:hypothetical protein
VLLGQVVSLPRPGDRVRERADADRERERVAVTGAPWFETTSEAKGTPVPGSAFEAVQIGPILHSSPE